MKPVHLNQLGIFFRLIKKSGIIKLVAGGKVERINCESRILDGTIIGFVKQYIFFLEKVCIAQF